MKDVNFPMVPEREVLKKRTNLIRYLSVAMNVKEHIISEILRKNKYILTLDYALKLIQIHERQQDKMPSIIMG